LEIDLQAVVKGIIFLKISKKRLRNTDLLLCKQQQKIEAKYSSATNAGDEDINLEDFPHLM